MKKLFLVFALVLTLTLAGCTETCPAPEDMEYVTPTTLEVQLIPSRDAEALNAQREPLELLLEAELGMPVNVTIATSYTTLIEAMGAGQVHVGLLATTSYVIAADQGYADVILKSLRYDVNDAGAKLTDEPLVDNYRSQLLVAKDSGITSVADLAGKTIAISSFTSTSGFVWPANLLADNDIDPENGVTWLNAGGHDLAVQAVYNGQADAAFTFKDARSIAGDLADLYTEVLFVLDTEPIPNDTISVIPNLDPILRAKVTQAFLNIAQSDDGLEIIQAIYSHEGYAIAVDEEYEIVRTYLQRQEEWDFE